MKKMKLNRTSFIATLLAAIMLMSGIISMTGAFAQIEGFVPKEPTRKEMKDFYTPIRINGYADVFYAFSGTDGLTKFRVFGEVEGKKGYFPVTVEEAEAVKDAGKSYIVSLADKNPVKDTSKDLSKGKKVAPESTPEGFKRGARNKEILRFTNLFGEEEYRVYGTLNGTDFGWFKTRNVCPVPGALEESIEGLRNASLKSGMKKYYRTSIFDKGYESEVILNLGNGIKIAAKTAYPNIAEKGVFASQVVERKAPADKPQKPNKPADKPQKPTDKPIDKPTDKPTPVVETKTETVTQSIPFKTERRENAEMLITDADKVVQKGVNGVRTIVYAVTYTDGKETDRAEKSNSITTQPVNEIIEYGTKKASGVATKEETITKEIAFETERRENANMLTTDPEKIVQQGVNGVRTIVYTVTYTDGVETNRVEKSNTITTKPINKIVEYGTKNPPVIETKTETVTEVIPFETKYDDVDSWPEGKEEVLLEGADGEKTVTYKVTYTDGVETAREVINEVITKEAQAKFIGRGTGKNVGTPEYESYPLSGGGVGGTQSSYWAGRAQAHAMAMAKAGKVFHSGGGGLESVAGSPDVSGMASNLVNHVPAFKKENVKYGFGCVRARTVYPDGTTSSWYYYGCLQGDSGEESEQP
ncbi:MAG: G5 domain-containing protein [Christensenellales bacterium]|jgi:uncharacterized protein YabE (DUF348 family)